MNWLKEALSEPDGTPSSQRLMLLILLIFTLDLLACDFWLSGKLPDIPKSLADLIEWLFTAAISGVSLGKISGAIGSFGNKPQPETPTA